MATELTPEHLQKLLNYGSELVASRGRLTHRHQSVAEKGYRNLLFAIFTRSPDVGPYTEQEVLEILSGDLGTVASLLEEMMFGAEELSLGFFRSFFLLFRFLVFFVFLRHVVAPFLGSDQPSANPH